MTKQTPPINTEVLRWARNEAGLSVTDAAKRARIGALKPRGNTPGLEPWERLKQWEEGSVTPSFRQLSNIAKAYRRPVLTFFLPAPPHKASALADYRTVGDHAANLQQSPEFAALMRRIKALQLSVKELMFESESQPIDFVSNGAITRSIVSAVSSIRNHLGFSFYDQQKVSNSRRLFAVLRDKIENLGIFVVLEGNLGSYHTAIPANVFRGVAISDNIAPFIVVNPNDSLAARVFTLVHELVHVWLGNTGISNLDYLSEEQNNYIENEHYCNRVSAEFLVPKTQLTSTWQAGMSDRELADYIDRAARLFKVSGICVARRLLDLHLVSSDKYWSFYDDYLEDLRRYKAALQKSDNGPSPAIMNKFRLGGLLALTVISAAQGGRISELDASQLLRVKINKFDSIYPNAA